MIELVDISTDEVVQAVETNANTCACSIAQPTFKENYCLRVVAADHVCSADFESTCRLELGLTEKTDFLVELVQSLPLTTGSASPPPSEQTSVCQTPVIVVINQDGTCFDQEAVVELRDCVTDSIEKTFTATEMNCATSFTLSASAKEYCFTIDAPNYTCAGGLQASCSSGRLELPIKSDAINKVEVAMKPTLGKVQVNLTFDQNMNEVADVSDFNVKEVTFNLVKENGTPVATEISTCAGGLFDNVVPATYNVTFDIAPGYVCQGLTLDGNTCSTKSFLLGPGGTEYIEVLLTKPSQGEARFTILYDGAPISGSTVNIFNATGVLIESCIIEDTSIDSCSFTSQSIGAEFLYQVLAPDEYACEGAQCAQHIVLNPGENKEIKVELAQASAPQAPAPQAPIAQASTTEIHIAVSYPGSISCATTTVNICDKPTNTCVNLTPNATCNFSFFTQNVSIEYIITVLSPLSSYSCSGDFNTNCTANVTPAAGEVKWMKCIVLPQVTPAPVPVPATPAPARGGNVYGAPEVAKPNPGNGEKEKVDTSNDKNRTRV